MCVCVWCRGCCEDVMQMCEVDNQVGAGSWNNFDGVRVHAAAGRMMIHTMTLRILCIPAIPLNADTTVPSNDTRQTCQQFSPLRGAPPLLAVVPCSPRLVEALAAFNPDLLHLLHSHSARTTPLAPCPSIIDQICTAASRRFRIATVPVSPSAPLRIPDTAAQAPRHDRLSRLPLADRSEGTAYPRQSACHSR